MPWMRQRTYSEPEFSPADDYPGRSRAGVECSAASTLQRSAGPGSRAVVLFKLCSVRHPVEKAAALISVTQDADLPSG
jgi:hypothetical protein